MENSKQLLTKETFCKALRMIREQEKINDEVCKALSKVADCFTFGCDNLWLQALRMVMKEAVNDKYDYIEWWLYEPPRIISWNLMVARVGLKEPEDLMISPTDVRIQSNQQSVR